MKPFPKLMVELIAAHASKHGSSFSDQELDFIRDCIAQNPQLEEEFFKLKHSVYTITNSIGVVLKTDLTFQSHFPELFI